MAFSDSKIDGGDILLEVDGKTIGCATTHSIEVSTETRDTSCKGSGSWSSTAPSRLSWSGSCDLLLNYEDSGTYVRYSDLWSLFVSKSTITVTSRYTEGTDEFVQFGEAIISGLSSQAGDKENATVSISFEGAGKLSVVGLDAFNVVITANGADFIFVEELQKGYSHTGSGTKSISVPESTAGYTFTAFSSGGGSVGSASTGAVAADSTLTIAVA